MSQNNDGLTADELEKLILLEDGVPTMVLTDGNAAYRVRFNPVDAAKVGIRLIEIANESKGRDWKVAALVFDKGDETPEEVVENVMEPKTGVLN